MMLKEKQSVNINSDTVSTSSKLEAVAPDVNIFVCALISFFVSAARVGGSGAPLCVSFIAVLSPSQGIAAFAASLVTYFFMGVITDRITEIAAMLGVLIIKHLISGVLGKSFSAVGLSVNTGIVYFISGVSVSFYYKFTLALGLAVAFRAILCAIITYFIFEVLYEYKSNNKLVISGGAGISTAVIYVLLICSFCALNIGTFNFGRCCGAFIILAVASKFGASGGSALGALTSLGITLSSYDLGKTSVLLTCVGLLAGAFSGQGKLLCSVVFIIANLIGSVVIGLPVNTVNLLVDIIIASVLFVVIPESFYSSRIAYITHKASPSLKNFSDRLLFASSALSDVRYTVEKASETLNRRDFEDENICSKVCSKVCSQCRSSAFCGEDDEYRIENYFKPAQIILEKKGYIVEDDLPKVLESCTKKTELVNEFYNAYSAVKLTKKRGNTSSSMRDIALEELSSVEDILKAFSTESNAFPYCDDNLSASIKKSLTSFGAKDPNVSVFYDFEEHIYIECFYEGKISVTMETLTEKLSDITDRELDSPLISTVDKVTKICMHEVPQFSVEIGHAGKNGSDAVSGDADNTFSDGFGRMYFLISDGMGSGRRAAVESCMTVSLLTRLIKSGVSPTAAIKLINLLMLTKSADEVFATVDLMSINLFSGKAEMIKLGAAPTYIKTNGNVKAVESWSSPIGIVSSVEFEKRTVRLSDGDNIVMLTDGVSEECSPKIKELMLSSGMTSQRIADEIVQYAEKNSSNFSDDKTVIVVKLYKNN